MGSLRWNKENMHKKLVYGKSRSRGGLNNIDINRIEKFYNVHFDQSGGVGPDNELSVLTLNVEYHKNMYKKWYKHLKGNVQKAAENALSSLAKGT